MKKIILLSVALMAFSFNSLKAQDESAPTKEVVTDPFSCEMLIETQTCVTAYKGGTEFTIHHRMGKIDEIKDLFGLYAPANIRIGYQRGITDHFMVGIGTEKNAQNQDINWKWTFMEQKKGGFPVFLTYYGNMVIRANKEDNYGEGYKFVDRFSYFHQLIISRKLCERASILVAPSFIHFNKVDTLTSNEALGLSFGGRVKIWNEISIMAEYQMCMPFEDITYPQDADGNDVPGAPKPGFSVGIVKNGGTHAFQLFATQFGGITPQTNLLYNQNTFDKNGLLIGFNLTIRL